MEALGPIPRPQPEPVCSCPDREPPNTSDPLRRFPYPDSNSSYHLERLPVAAVHPSARPTAQWPAHHPVRIATIPPSATIRSTIPDHPSIPNIPNERRFRAPNQPPLVPILRQTREATPDHPPISAVHRQTRSITPNRPPIVAAHRQTRSVTPDYPPIRLTTFEQPATRASSMHFERPITLSKCTPLDKTSGEGFDSSGTCIGADRPATVCGSRVRFERRASQPVLSSSPDSGQVQSEGSAEWGSQESVEHVDIHQHIRHCSCTCNHMGYGNYMDFQETKHEGTLPAMVGRRIQRGSAEDEEIPLDTLPKEDEESGRGKVTKEPQTKAACRPRVRKKWLPLLGLLISLIFIGGIGFSLYLQSLSTPESRLELVRKTLREVPLVDGHNDLPWNIHKFVFNQLASFNLSADLRNKYPWNSTFSQTDLPRLRAGQVGAQFWSAYVPCTSQAVDALTLTLGQIDVIKRFSEFYSKDFMLAKTTKDIIETHRMGKIASLIGLEGGHSMDNSLGVLRMQYEVGARYLTLTHQCDTPWAECCVDSPPEYAMGPDPPVPRKKGLTEFGNLVIREMNRLGMIIDLSHSSITTMNDTLEATKAPVIFSHSCAYALCNSTGNVPDEILRRLPENGGMVMVSFYSKFLTCSNDSTLRDVIAHINHIRAVAGIDHVGIGAGFDGVDRLPVGLEDSSKYPVLLAALLEDPKWSVEDIKKLAGLNFIRVFREVETVREKWRRAGVRPVEERIPHEDLKGLTKCIYKDG